MIIYKMNTECNNTTEKIKYIKLLNPENKKTTKEKAKEKYKEKEEKYEEKLMKKNTVLIKQLELSKTIELKEKIAKEIFHINNEIIPSVEKMIKNLSDQSLLSPDNIPTPLTLEDKKINEKYYKLKNQYSKLTGEIEQLKQEINTR